MSINRIRLEFKAIEGSINSAKAAVLIESDWNLKEEQKIIDDTNEWRINRIRLEFKGHIVSYVPAFWPQY